MLMLENGRVMLVLEDGRKCFEIVPVCFAMLRLKIRFFGMGSDAPTPRDFRKNGDFFLTVRSIEQFEHTCLKQASNL